MREYIKVELDGDEILISCVCGNDDTTPNPFEAGKMDWFDIEQTNIHGLDTFTCLVCSNTQNINENTYYN